MSESLRSVIAAWDGKAVEPLLAAFARWQKEPAFVPELVALLDDAGTESGASWLLKRHLETGGTIEAEATRRLLRGLGGLSHWSARLHVLQCLPYLAIDQAASRHVAPFLRAALDDSSKLVRAWAYNGFDVLARQHPRFRREAKALLEAAATDEAPSVRARIRNILGR